MSYRAVRESVDRHYRHFNAAVVRDAASACERHLAGGGRMLVTLAGAGWVHLRPCLTCGCVHVGCCDSSPHRHATRHVRESGHPIVQSFEPGEDRRWCYVDQTEV